MTDEEQIAINAEIDSIKAIMLKSYADYIKSCRAHKITAAEIKKYEEEFDENKSQLESLAIKGMNEMEAAEYMSKKQQLADLIELSKKTGEEIAANDGTWAEKYTYARIDELEKINDERDALQFYFMTDIEKIEQKKGAYYLKKKWEWIEEHTAGRKQ